MAIATRVLAIPCKREDKKLIGYLTREEIEALLAAPDRSQWIGRRDYALLLTMYNSGARVSEIVTLTRRKSALVPGTFLQLHGKGRKERTVPLWPDTARVLKSWFQELEAYRHADGIPQCPGQSALALWRQVSAPTRCPRCGGALPEPLHEDHHAACGEA